MGDGAPVGEGEEKKGRQGRWGEEGEDRFVVLLTIVGSLWVRGDVWGGKMGKGKDGTSR